MFQVFDNNLAADWGIPNSTAYNSGIFDNFEDACKYAIEEYLGYDNVNPDLIIELNTPWDYSGYGDMIEIREV